MDGRERGARVDVSFIHSRRYTQEDSERREEGGAPASSAEKASASGDVSGRRIDVVVVAFCCCCCSGWSSLLYFCWRSIHGWMEGSTHCTWVLFLLLLLSLRSIEGGAKSLPIFFLPSPIAQSASLGGLEGLCLCDGVGVELEVGGFGEVREGVEVEVAIGIRGGGVDRGHELLVFVGGGEAAEDGGDGGELGGGEVDVGALAEAVREVARRRGDDGGLVLDAGLVAHAEGAAGHLRACADLAEDGVVALVDELGGVHFGGGADPEPRR
mmetsp:Transcript_12532/g.41003  ORF Transcript_12532/g.41003 Transcript_12532/m.41003 type:complete len:269 (+) Transcript_12532:435-1241(+)